MSHQALCECTGDEIMREKTHSHCPQGASGVVSQFSRSVVSDSATPWTAVHQASLSITDSQSLLKLMSKIVIVVGRWWM